MLSIKELHQRAGNLDLSHWNAAETFSLIEAALLSIGLDPLDSDKWDRLPKLDRAQNTELELLQKIGHPNWKYGMLLLRSLKEGVCTGEIKCIEIIVKDNVKAFGNWVPIRVDVLDLSAGLADDLHEGMTKITRKALYDWYRRKGLLSKPTPSHYALTKNSEINASGMITIDAQPLLLAAPSYLDPDNPLSPIELRASVTAWEIVTTEGGAESGKAIKDRLRAALEAHVEYKHLSNDAKSRICTVTNWNKKGGAPKTPE
jgi:hypothetical protein